MKKFFRFLVMFKIFHLKKQISKLERIYDQTSLLIAITDSDASVVYKQILQGVREGVTTLKEKIRNIEEGGEKQ